MSAGNILGIVGCVLFALFAVGAWYESIKQKKEQKKEMELKDKQLEREQEFMRKYEEEKAENEELLRKINSPDSAESFSAGINQLRNVAEKGKQRNS